jgi:hypothetical protein
MSDLFVDNIKHQSSQGSGTITLGTSGEKITTASGAEFSNITGHMYPAFEAYRQGDKTFSDNTFTKVEFNTEVFDTDSCYDTTNFRFTPNRAGKYFVYSTLVGESSAARRIEYMNYRIYKNGSVAANVTPVYSADNISWQSTGVISKIIDMNGTTDYLEMYIRLQDFANGSPKYIGTNSTSSAFGAYRLGA